jgi:putative transposase
MSTYTQIYYHIVFSTKGREPVLKADRRQDLFGYVWGILKNKQGHLYRIITGGQRFGMNCGVCW